MRYKALGHLGMHEAIDASEALVTGVPCSRSKRAIWQTCKEHSWIKSTSGQACRSCQAADWLGNQSIGEPLPRNLCLIAESEELIFSQDPTGN